jgi:hypothetical protein
MASLRTRKNAVLHDQIVHNDEVERIGIWKSRALSKMQGHPVLFLVQKWSVLELCHNHKPATAKSRVRENSTIHHRTET